MSTHIFLEDASRYKKNNTILIDNSPKKSILNDARNVVFLKSWKHTMKNFVSDAYLTIELGPWIERLHKEGHSEVPRFVNSNQLDVNPLILDDVLYDLVMDESRPK